jgi:D-glycerate 3-kinase|tara:strand:- start:313 stop:1191 length:879 start_codon:yes stop_codon:yes gene_type:complete
MYQQLIKDFIQQERLPSTYLLDATQYFLPLVRDIKAEIQSSRKGPFLIGINGAQGTGKSTLAKLLSALLTSSGYRTVNLSIDDFYYSKAKRQELADEIHPLLRSRGVPGTHDVDLALNLIEQLCAAGSNQQITLPRFDKSLDDCRPVAACEQIQGPIDIIILEGWFVGAKAQAGDELTQAINELEINEDSDGRWRAYVNQQLAGSYQSLFEKIHILLMLQAPGFEQILEWRSLQEEKLRALAVTNASGLMDRKAIKHFIQHFERLTRHCLRTLPDSADRVFQLNTEHRITVN